MAECGRVVSVSGGTADIIVERSGMCAKCGVCSVLDSGNMRATARNPVGAGIGDLVEVELAQGSILSAAAIVYMVPLLFFFAGYFLGAALGARFQTDGEPLGILVGLIALVLSFWFVSRYDRKARERGDYQLMIIQVLKGGR